MARGTCMQTSTRMHSMYAPSKVCALSVACRHEHAYPLSLHAHCSKAIVNWAVLTMQATRIKQLKALAAKARSANCHLTIITEMDTGHLARQLGYPVDTTITTGFMDLRPHDTLYGLSAILKDTIARQADGPPRPLDLLHLSAPGTCTWKALDVMNQEVGATTACYTFPCTELHARTVMRTKHTSKDLQCAMNVRGAPTAYRTLPCNPHRTAHFHATHTVPHTSMQPTPYRTLPCRSTYIL